MLLICDSPVNHCLFLSHISLKNFYYGINPSINIYGFLSISLITLSILYLYLSIRITAYYGNVKIYVCYVVIKLKSVYWISCRMVCKVSNKTMAFVRLKEEDKAIIKKIAEYYDVSESDAVKIAVKHLAKELGLLSS